MGIRKSKITPSINVDEMLKKAEISHEIETEKQDVDKRSKEICEIKETLLKIQQDLQDAIKIEGNTMLVNEIANNQHTIIENQKVIYNCMKSLTNNQDILEDRLNKFGLSDTTLTEIQSKFDEMVIHSATRFTNAIQDKCNRYIKCIEFSDQAFIIPPVTAWCLFAIIFSLSSFFGLIIVANTLVWNSRMIWHITFIISGFAIVTVSAIVLVYKYLMKDD